MKRLKLLKKRFDQAGQKIKVLLDVSDFSGEYCVEAVEKLAEFAKHNEPKILKTASFGGSLKVEAAGEMVTALSGRDNIKIFKTKEEALEWLNS